MSKCIPLILFTVLTNATAQILLKKGMLQVGSFDFQPGAIFDAAVKTLLNPYVFFGLFTFTISMVSHLVVLSRVDISFAYPFLSLAYVVVAIYAYYFFQEDINAYRIAGIALIVCGAVLVAQS